MAVTITIHHDTLVARIHAMAQLRQAGTMPEISMPMFGRATQGPNQSDWGEVDNFDVELLAEYLLEDSSGVPGVTFDFK